MTLAALRARLKEAREKANKIVKDAEANEDGLLTDDQQTQFDAIMKDAKKIAENIERLEALNDAIASDAEGLGRQTEAAAPTVHPKAADKRENEMCGFKDASDFGRAVRDACVKGRGVDERLAAIPKITGAATNFMREGGAEEGYMVPPAMRDAIWDQVYTPGDDIFSDIEAEPTSSNSVEMYADESTPWGAAGVQAYWGDEGAPMTASKLATKGKQVKLHKLHALVSASEELIEDAPRLNNRLTVAAGNAIRWKASEAYVNGTGVGQPLGILKSAALVAVAKEAGQAADTLVAQNIAKMYSRQLRPGSANWYMNQDVLPQLIGLMLGDKPIWTPPVAGFADAPGGFLLGRPIKFTDHNPTLGDEGDILLADPAGYFAAQKQGGMKFASSIHLYFDQGLEAFRWTFRLGGQPFLSAPVNPAKGNNTRSHFVTLAARA